MCNAKNVLWISPYAPYDRVRHAGGKNHNYYLKYLHQSGRYNITLLSLCMKEEEQDLDLDQYGIKNDIFVMDRSKGARFQRRAVSACSYVNPFDRCAGVCLTYERHQMTRLIQNYFKKNRTPDIVILQWTFSVMLLPKIKKIFPESAILSIEEDVTFLGYERRWKTAESPYQKWFWKQRYCRIRRLEPGLLEQSDLTVTNNPKDTNLLLESGLDASKIFTSIPYYDDYSGIARRVRGRDILFYGQMSREENYNSAVWFIQKVLPLLREENVRFVVVGGNPPSKLAELASDQVRIEGYVEDVRPYFEHSICFAAPLLRGAGIKIKILEALSSGIPVLTNHIGIEGIGAKPGRDYLHCETAPEYAKAIRAILHGEMDVQMLQENARAYMKNYDLSKRLDALMDRMDEIEERRSRDKC